MGYDPDQQNTGNDPAFRFVDHIYLYDRAGRPLQLSQGSTLVSGYGYDAAGNRSYWNNAGTEVTYADPVYSAGAVELLLTELPRGTEGAKQDG